MRRAAHVKGGGEGAIGGRQRYQTGSVYMHGDGRGTCIVAEQSTYQRRQCGTCVGSQYVLPTCPR